MAKELAMESGHTSIIVFKPSLNQNTTVTEDKEKKTVSLAIRD